MWQLITSVIVLAAPLLVILYDVIAYRIGGEEATITSVVQWFAAKFPELPALAAGVFVWLWLHLFMTPILEGINKRHPPDAPPVIKNGMNKKE